MFGRHFDKNDMVISFLLSKICCVLPLSIENVEMFPLTNLGFCLRGVCRRKKIRKKCGLLPNRGGGSPRVNKKPNLKFGVLKRVKNGLKWIKNPGGGGQGGVWQNATLFPGFFSAYSPNGITIWKWPLSGKVASSISAL